MMVGGEGGRGSGSQDFELNLASIIDCLTVLIAFMLASASFLSIGILDAGVAAAGAAPKDQAPPSVNIAVELRKDQSMILKVTGKVNSTTTIPVNAAKAWDHETLAQNLVALKAKWTDANAVTLTAENAVEYRHVVKTMESMRKTIPVVLLGGF
jgi:biopolymer transport protein ExbD